jgi:ATP synthase protein I
MLDNGRKQSAERTASALRAAAMLTGIPFLLGACVAAGVFGGRWLDQKLGTDPWLTVVCALLGTAAGFREMFRLVAQLGTGKKGRGS